MKIFLIILFASMEEPTLVTPLAISTDKVTTDNSFKSSLGSIISMRDNFEPCQ